MDGIHAHLNTYLLTYQPQLNAIVLAYHDIQLLSTAARIFYDRPYLNFPIQLSVLALSLPAGTAQYGRVSKVGLDHITLLVYGVFHCVIQRADIPAWYEYGVLDSGGRRTDLMADTRRGAIDGWQPRTKSSLASTAAADGADEQLSKKQAAKQKKQAEKEERRQAYLRSQQSNTNIAADSTSSAQNDDDTLDYAIRLGSLVRFVILTSVGHDSFFSMSGSLTAEGATVVPGDVVVPAELQAKEEAEAEERRSREVAEATSVERLFAGEEDDAAEAADTTATVTQEGEAHVSKKELKERKKQEKANRKAAKLLRKQLHSHTPQPTLPAGQVRGVTVRERADVMRRREREEEEEVVERRREEDNEVYSVVVDKVYSHVDEHVIDGKDEESQEGQEVERRKRGREDVNGMKVEGREKKKRREKGG